MTAFASTTLSVPASTLGVRIAGAAANDRTGYFLASLGDINGDGFSDAILGMDPQNSPPGGVVVSSVIFGKASGWGDIDLANLGTAGFRLTVQPFEGAPTYGTIAVSSAGDVNGDGYDDILIGSAFADSLGRGNNGASWVVYGKAGGWSDIDLRQPLGNAGARINGAAGGDYTGRTVAAAGDVNGDGYDDIVVGGQNYASFGPGAFAGSAFIVFGSASGVPNLDLSSPGGAAWRIDGAPGDNIGREVASAGDINGDGLADIITAGLTTIPGQTPSSASAFVVFGKTSGFGTLDLVSLGQGGFRIDGIAPGSVGDVSVASAGDFNGDGYTDLVIGAAGADSRGFADNGSAYLILGHAGGFSTINLGDPAQYALRIDGAAGSNFAGASVASAGDVNGDGYADILVGAFYTRSNPITAEGTSYLILGGAGSSFTPINLAQDYSNVFRFRGGLDGDRQGFAVAGAGDADGDGFADLLLGSLTADAAGRVDSGAAYLLFSQSAGPALYRGTTLADTLRGTPDGDTLLGFGQNDTLYGGAGNDTLNGGAGNDILDGGAGVDVASYSGSRPQYVVSVLGDQALVSGPDGTDRLSGIEILAFGDALLPLSPDATAGLFLVSGGLGSGFRLPELYSGPVTRLQTQLLGSASSDLAIGTALNDFFNLLGGDDAVQAGAGDDVIDGGTGSNFLTGGAGRDDFFLDGRGLGTTWSTITDWQAGETLSVFGWTPGVSRMIWRDSDGTEGYKGVTMHADLDGNGLIETSVTWAGLTQAALPVPQSLSGLLWFT